jgi:hypothetical protein
MSGKVEDPSERFLAVVGREGVSILKPKSKTASRIETVVFSPEVLKLRKRLRLP